MSREAHTGTAVGLRVSLGPKLFLPQHELPAHTDRGPRRAAPPLKASQPVLPLVLRLRPVRSVCSAAMTVTDTGTAGLAALSRDPLAGLQVPGALPMGLCGTQETPSHAEQPWLVLFSPPSLYSGKGRVPVGQGHIPSPAVAPCLLGARS